MDLRSIYSSTFAVFRETNTFSPNSCRKMKSSTLLNAINRCRKMAGNGLALEANFERLENLVKHSRLHSRNVWSFIDENVQKPLYDFRISKVMAVCINTCTSICGFQSYSKIDQSRTDFIISTGYLLRNSGLFPASAIFQAFL